MRIGINLLYLIPEVVGGTETYARELIQSLLPQLSQNDELIVFCSRETAITFKPRLKLRVVTLPFYSHNRIARILVEQILLPVACQKNGIDLLLSLGYTQPFFLPCKSIVTIHDLNWHYHPEDFSLTARLLLQLLVTISVNRSSAIIAISSATKQSLVKVLAVEPNKISVIYHGMTKSVIDKRMIKQVREKFSLPNKYLFTVLSHYAHKNLETLIKAFLVIQKDEHDLHLVIAGTGTDSAKKLRANYLNERGNQNIHQLPFVTTQELATVYQESKIFVFPSAYEGFGLPVLEAMSHKVPAISSKAYSLNEVVGNGGILVDPYDANQYILSIKKLLNNETLRHKYISAGLKQVGQFTWDKCARATLVLINATYATQ